jgi:hypothetical protein
MNNNYPVINIPRGRTSNQNKSTTSINGDNIKSENSVKSNNSFSKERKNSTTIKAEPLWERFYCKYSDKLHNYKEKKVNSKTKKFEEKEDLEEIKRYEQETQEEFEKRTLFIEKLNKNQKKLIYTPIPKRPKVIKNEAEKNEFIKAERNASMMRKYEYCIKLKERKPVELENFKLENVKAKYNLNNNLSGNVNVNTNNNDTVYGKTSYTNANVQSIADDMNQDDIRDMMARRIQNSFKDYKNNKNLTSDNRKIPKGNSVIKTGNPYASNHIEQELGDIFYTEEDFTNAVESPSVAKTNGFLQIAKLNNVHIQSEGNKNKSIVEKKLTKPKLIASIKITKIHRSIQSTSKIIYLQQYIKSYLMILKYRNRNRAIQNKTLYKPKLTGLKITKLSRNKIFINNIINLQSKIKSYLKKKNTKPFARRFIQSYLCTKSLRNFKALEKIKFIQSRVKEFIKSNKAHLSQNLILDDNKLNYLKFAELFVKLVKLELIPIKKYIFTKIKLEAKRSSNKTNDRNYLISKIPRRNLNRKKSGITRRRSSSMITNKKRICNKADNNTEIDINSSTSLKIDRVTNREGIDSESLTKTYVRDNDGYMGKDNKINTMKDKEVLGRKENLKSFIDANKPEKNIGYTQYSEYDGILEDNEYSDMVKLGIKSDNSNYNCNQVFFKDDCKIDEKGNNSNITADISRNEQKLMDYNNIDNQVDNTNKQYILRGKKQDYDNTTHLSLYYNESSKCNSTIDDEKIFGRKGKIIGNREMTDFKSDCETDINKTNIDEFYPNTDLGPNKKSYLKTNINSNSKNNKNEIIMVDSCTYMTEDRLLDSALHIDNNANDTTVNKKVIMVDNYTYMTEDKGVGLPMDYKTNKKVYYNEEGTIAKVDNSLAMSVNFKVEEKGTNVDPHLGIDKNLYNENANNQFVKSNNKENSQAAISNQEDKDNSKINKTDIRAGILLFITNNTFKKATKDYRKLFFENFIQQYTKNRDNLNNISAINSPKDKLNISAFSFDPIKEDFPKMIKPIEKSKPIRVGNLPSIRGTNGTLIKRNEELNFANLDEESKNTSFLNISENLSVIYK